MSVADDIALSALVKEDAELRRFLVNAPLQALMEKACAARDQAHPRLQSYSPKVFIPLTRLCRDYCHYCTFSRPAQDGAKTYMTVEEVLSVARAGQAAGCTEALFTLGDKPEMRHDIARRELKALGHDTTLSYLEDVCAAVIDETGLLPHINAGVMSKEALSKLAGLSVSQGLMLETASERLCGKGMPHYRSPDKDPAVRIQMIRDAGELRIPFTSGILIGIGETREERLDSLFLLRELHREYGHIQEIIIQNFRAKPGTPMQDAAEPEMDELCWTIASARLIFEPAMNIQAPPNLSSGTFADLIDAGINDWGGVSPVTPDYVNPEAPWPMIDLLRRKTAEKGRVLVKRLPLYPAFCRDTEKWTSPAIAPLVRRASDTSGFSRNDDWRPGAAIEPTVESITPGLGAAARIEAILSRTEDGEELCEQDIVELFEAHDRDVETVCSAADRLRHQTVGDTVTYVVNRNINYTNICAYSCGFCAFSKGRGHDSLRGAPYDLALEEIVRRATEAAGRGASEVCLQGGIHPAYTGEKYLAVCAAIRDALPDMHIHAFSPLEVMHGSATLNLSVETFLCRLKDAGLNTLPGTAAEILDDSVRAKICPDKLSSREWLYVMEAAHSAGLKTTSTIMFGHVDHPEHWARHLLQIRALQKRTNGFTEFVPLPFVHMEAPMAKKGLTRLGPTFREVRLMHAVARLTLHPHIQNIQTSWVKLGVQGAQFCLQGGANDLGGTLMNESISRAAGSEHGQEMPPQSMETMIRAIGRTPLLRTTKYEAAPDQSRRRAFSAAPLDPVVLTPPERHARAKQPLENL